MYTLQGAHACIYIYIYVYIYDIACIVNMVNIVSNVHIEHTAHDVYIQYDVYIVFSLHHAYTLRYLIWVGFVYVYVWFGMALISFVFVSRSFGHRQGLVGEVIGYVY